MPVCDPMTWALLCIHGEVKAHHIVPPLISEPIVFCPGGSVLPDDTLLIPEPIVRPLGTPLTYAGVEEVWNCYVKPEQDQEIPPSIEMRCLMAILRAVAEGYHLASAQGSQE